MAWDFKVVEDAPASSAGSWVPMGLKIVKTFTDENGIELVTVNASMEDAIENAEPGFDLEYYEALKTLFRSQLERILTEGDSGVLNFSLGSIYGKKFEQGLAIARMLKEGKILLNDQ